MEISIQVKNLDSWRSHLAEFLISGIIFTVLVFFGLHVFNFKIVSGDTIAGSQKNIARVGPDSPKSGVQSEEPLISSPLPSQDELIRQLINANRPPRKNQTPRHLAPWEKQVREITAQNIPPSNKAQQLLALAQTLTGDEQARVYAATTSVVPPAMFQQQLYPMIWNSSTPASVVRILATGVITQPDSFKFPSLLALMKHSDEGTRAMAESVLWAYFPDEPSANYPQAVQRFLSGSY